MPAAALAVVAILAALGARATQASALAGQLTVTGPWQGKNAAAFGQVLAGFEKQNPGVTVTYKPATGDVATALQQSAGAQQAQLAVLTLPTDLKAMTTMARTGALRPIDFAGSALDSNYAFTWKQAGVVGGKLTGLVFDASNTSAFWYDTKALASLGLRPPSTLGGLEQMVGRIKAHGLTPFALGGRDHVALPNLFENLYLALQGNSRYGKLMNGQIRWSDPSVSSTLRVLKRMFGTGLSGGTASLGSSYSTAVKKVFGSPMKAYLVPGGSDVLPVVTGSPVMRPLSQFSTFAFPRTSAKAPPRVIGTAHAVVMTKDTPEARALVDYLATPEAATTWVKQATNVLSPNRKVAADAYAEPALRGLAQSLTAANVFRYSLSDVQGAKVKKVLGVQLVRYLQGKDTIGDVTSRLMIAAGEQY
ncbi:MAG TPA: ABC transporter substrate-binding protein [Gaiellaceae bacterium]|nr:ABC transporter substrate-binding protein [Gaiellaceae bacterium]